MTDREKAKREYLGGKSLKDIASELGVKDSTARAWKSRGGWPKVQRKRVAKRKSVAAPENVAVKPKAVAEPLNDRQQLFCELYVKTWNGTQAYMTVYGTDYHSACTAASRLLAKDNIRAYIQSLKEIKKQAILAGPEDVVEKYMKIAFANIGDYVTFGRKDVQVMTAFGPLYEKDSGDEGKKIPVMKTVNYVDIKESSAVDAGVIQEISQGKDGIRIKLADQMKALDWLSKYFNMNPTDQHKREYDSKKQELDRLEYERRKKKDESENW